MVTKIETYKTLADFQKLGKRITSGVGNVQNLMQHGLIAAFEHIEKHGDVHVLEPLASAVVAFRSKSLAIKWQQYVVHYTWFTFNPNKLKGAKLAAATFPQLWVKTKGKSMNIDGAKASHWYDFDGGNVEREAKPIDVNAEAARLVKRINEALKDGRALNVGGAKMSAHEVRAVLKIAIEGIAEERKPITEASPTKVARQRNKQREAIAKAKADKVAPVAANAA